MFAGPPRAHVAEWSVGGGGQRTFTQELRYSPGDHDLILTAFTFGSQRKTKEQRCCLYLNCCADLLPLFYGERRDSRFY